MYSQGRLVRPWLHLNFQIYLNPIQTSGEADSDHHHRGCTQNFPMIHLSTYFEFTYFKRKQNPWSFSAPVIIYPAKRNIYFVDQLQRQFMFPFFERLMKMKLCFEFTVTFILSSNLPFLLWTIYLDFVQ